MTKVTDLTKEAKEENVLKKIEFVKYVSPHWDQNLTQDKPYDYKNIDLIFRKYGGVFDLMFGFNDERSCGGLYLGHYNDGIV